MANEATVKGNTGKLQDMGVWWLFLAAFEACGVRDQIKLELVILCLQLSILIY